MRHTYKRNKVRFGWWSAEESGLVGSTFYIDSLNEEELGNIKAYLNFDMISSPNAGNFVYDSDGSDFGLEGLTGSKAVEGLFEKYFKLRGQPTEGIAISFRSDYAQFFVKDIAFVGLFTGAEGIMSAEQAKKFDGDAKHPFDSLYHRECDDINNFDMRTLKVNADAAAFVTSWLSLSTRLVDREMSKAQQNEPQENLTKRKTAINPKSWGGKLIR